MSLTCEGSARSRGWVGEGMSQLHLCPSVIKMYLNKERSDHELWQGNGEAVTRQAKTHPEKELVQGVKSDTKNSLNPSIAESLPEHHGV